MLDYSKVNSKAYRSCETIFARNMLKWSLDGSGSLILVGGDPGVGKSTLLLQVLSQMQFPLDYFLMFVVWMQNVESYDTQC
jgi:predicted ATP-dependent serine protease